MEPLPLPPRSLCSKVEDAWRDQRKKTIRKLWMSLVGKHEEGVVYGAVLCLCHRDVRTCVSMCKYPCVNIHWSVGGSLPQQDVCMNVIVRVSPRAACQLFVLEFVLMEKRSLDAELPLLLLWWKAALIEWPGTQPPFLIITAVQSLLITLKACRAPHSPVMLRAIRGSGRKIRRFWQNPLSKKS